MTFFARYLRGLMIFQYGPAAALITFAMLAVLLVFPILAGVIFSFGLYGY